MHPGLHFFLLRYGRFSFLLLAASLFAWFYNESSGWALLFFSLPAFLLPLLIRMGLRARCRGCKSPVSLSEKNREEGVVEYIYRCRSCTCQHHTGYRFRRDPAPGQTRDE